MALAHLAANAHIVMVSPNNIPPAAIPGEKYKVGVTGTVKVELLFMMPGNEYRITFVLFRSIMYCC